MKAYEVVIYRCKGCKQPLIQQKDRSDMFCCETVGCQQKNLCLQVEQKFDPFQKLKEQITELNYLNQRLERLRR